MKLALIYMSMLAGLSGCLLAGCSSSKHAEAPSQAATGSGSPRCRKAAERLVELMSASSAADPDSIKEITDKVAAHCDGDGWDEKTTNCISTLPDKDHLPGCEPMFTDAQKQKLVEAFESSAPPAGGAPPSPGAAPMAAPPPQPSSAMPTPAPPPAKKKSDPCEGGQ